MLVKSLFTCTVLAQGIAASGTQNETRNSVLMAKSIISRNEGIFTSTGDSSEPLQAGFVQKAFRALNAQYPDSPSASTIDAYVTRSADSLLGIFSNVTTILRYSLDRYSSGNEFVRLYEETGNETYRTAFEALRESIDLQPRNAENGIWYYVYPNWSYLDGLFSIGPFYTLYTSEYVAENSTVWDDIILQFDLLWTHCLNSSSGLLVHGYDSSRTAVWADPVTGASPHVWGRSLGWYAMALIDTLDVLDSTPANSTGAEKLKSYLEEKYQSLIPAIIDARDETTGAWWQVIDQPGREGNYIESSGSSMFVYAILKGLRLGYLLEDASPQVAAHSDESTPSSYTEVAARAYEYIEDTFPVDNGNGTLGWNGTVSVCSLNSTASYEYYVGRPLLYDSVLGSAAFVLASLEYERLEQ
ncbi:putative cell wall glycosyl hydrolase YteR [Corynespora cassiicola Philippines]|uniref:Putative cell wall glycosyl hydrolase YteR n=1 Tax=Corynespora cassiicola Philippines TaxID=1448308 RepID=A0A2T2P6E8_CORCC|nr:putative cell wall glycosyl hydrolase YteR [Corynespora cassiicola Philippines]